MNIMQPIVNLNGTGREELIDLRLAARDAILTAMRRLGEMRPHGRDYIGNSDAYHRDLFVHNERIHALDSMINDLFDEALLLRDNA
jgi:hypothetical protein